MSRSKRDETRRDETGQLRLFLLQTPTFFVDDRPITTFNSNKTRAMLCYLAMMRQMVARTTLAGLFWGEMPEEKAHTNLRKSIANLKKSVGAFLTITRQAVGMAADANVWIDAAVFANAPSAEAVALYKGDFLQGLFVGDSAEFEQWVLTQRTRLREQMLAALHEQIAVGSQRGDFAAAIGFCQQLLGMEPWREETQRDLMLLYARQGERSAALAQYERCKTVLDAEFGIEPSEETRTLMRRIRYASTPDHNLPPPAASLLGRSAECAHLHDQLTNEQTRLITLVGAGGMGKTRLALAIAAQIRPHFLEGVWLIDGTRINDLSQLPSAIATAINFHPDATKPLQPQLLATLKAKEMLLLFDNMEHLTDGRGLLSEILRTAPHVKLLVTSRQQMQLRDEYVVTVEGLSLEGAAVELFGRTWQRDPAENLPTIHEICHLVAGSPLAIELAAANARFLPCDYIANAIRDNLDVLQTTMPDVPARHRSVRAVFDHSWRMLSVEEQMAFAQLAIFRGGFTLEAALTVCTLTPPILMQLVSKSLLRRTTETRYVCHELLRQYAWEKVAAERDPLTDRYSDYYLDLLNREGRKLDNDDSIAAQAVLQTDIHNIQAAWDHAAATWQVAQLNTSLPNITTYYRLAGDFERQDTILSTLIAALRQRISKGRGVDATHLALFSRACASHATVLTFQGAFDAAVAAAIEAVEIAEELGDQNVLANALINLAGTHFRRSQYDEMKAVLDKMPPDLPDGLYKARAINWRGVWHARMRQSADAIALYNQSRAIAEVHQLRSEESIALLNLGVRLDSMGNFAEAERYLRQSLAIARRIGSWRREGSTLASLALIDYRFNRPARAKERLVEVIALYHKVGNQLRLGQPYTYLGIVYQGELNYREAETYLRTGLRYYAAQGHRSSQVMALGYLCRTLVAQGKTDEATACWERIQQLGNDAVSFILMAVIAQIEGCLLVEDAARAEQFISDYAKLVESDNDPILRSWFGAAEAGWHLLCGRMEMARESAENAVTISQNLVPIYRIDALQRLGEILLAQADWQRAQTVWETLHAIRQELNHTNEMATAMQKLVNIRSQL